MRWRSTLFVAAASALAAGCLCPPGYVGWSPAGRSAEGRPIRKLVVGHGRSVTLIFGAFHGDEPESADLARRFAEYVWSNPAKVNPMAVVVVPEVNPDGLARGTRANANGVDINRNVAVSNWMPRKRRTGTFPGEIPNSEPESRVVMRLIERYRPDVVVSIHSIRSGKECVNYDGPARDLAEKMSRHCGYPAKASIGYPTPGSFGTYSGKELNIPTITLELPRGADVDKIWEPCRRALMEAVTWRPRVPLKPGRPGRLDRSAPGR